MYIFVRGLRTAAFSPVLFVAHSRPPPFFVAIDVFLVMVPLPFHPLPVPASAIIFRTHNTHPTHLLLCVFVCDGPRCNAKVPPLLSVLVWAVVAGCAFHCVLTSSRRVSSTHRRRHTQKQRRTRTHRQSFLSCAANSFCDWSCFMLLLTGNRIPCC
jgi:hypothetical protein